MSEYNEQDREERLRRARALADSLFLDPSFNSEHKSSSSYTPAKKNNEEPKYSYMETEGGARVFRSNRAEPTSAPRQSGGYSQSAMALLEERRSSYSSPVEKRVPVEDSFFAGDRVIDNASDKKEKKKGIKRKFRFFRFLLGLISILVIIVALVLLVDKLTSLDLVSKAEEYMYELTGGVVVHEVDFQNAVLGESRKQQTLVVFEKDVAVESQLSQSLLNLDVFTKTQKIRSHGTGSYAIDMLSIAPEDVTADEELKTVTIKIPKAYLYVANYDVAKTEYEDTENGFLTFGDIKLSPEEQTEFETGISESIKSALNTPSCFDEANASAIEAVKSIFEPIVKSVSEEYTVKVEMK